MTLPVVQPGSPTPIARERSWPSGAKPTTLLAIGSRPSIARVVVRYAYDAAGQLIEEAADASTGVRYRYLPGGNRAERVTGSDIMQYRYDQGNQLLAAGAESFAYDANGNLVERRGPEGVTRYAYDAENRLVKALRPDDAEVSFGYAPTGERIWRRDSTGLTYFVHDGLDLVAELGSDLTPKATYIHGPDVDLPLAMARDGQSYFYLPDALGSVARLTDVQGRIASAYEYDAFGVPRATTGSVCEPVCVHRPRYESAIGLYFYRARYYDPRLGRSLHATRFPDIPQSPFVQPVCATF